MLDNNDYHKRIARNMMNTRRPLKAMEQTAHL